MSFALLPTNIIGIWSYYLVKGANMHERSPSIIQNIETKGISIGLVTDLYIMDDCGGWGYNIEIGVWIQFTVTWKQKICRTYVDSS